MHAVIETRFSTNQCSDTIAINVIFNKYKTFSVLIYSYINTSGNWENEKFVWKHDASVFIQFRVFPISTSVDITIYQYGKKFYICFII